MINLMQTSLATNPARRKSLVASSILIGSLALAPVTQASSPLYKLIDLGTFGGPESTMNPGSPILGRSGTVVGAGDTGEVDPNFGVANYNGFLQPDPFIQHAFQCHKGVVTDLGAFPGANSSFAFAANAAGDVVGYSGNGEIDPLTGAPEVRAVLWRDGKIINLGALGGNESQAQDINNRGQIVGTWANSIPDEFSAYGFGTQTRAFLWERGVMRDLGTLGGPDATPASINERGQIAGASLTDGVANPITGFPTLHPFLWERGQMVDLGSLGGSMAGANALNNHGQVAGLSNLPGDLTAHPFFWDGRSLRDLGTFGGDNGEANSLNDEGEVVGVADFPDGVHHNAFLWQKGVMTDLGNLGETSHAYSINARGQVVGASRVSFITGEIRAFLWQKGRVMVDLNNLIPMGSSLTLTVAYSINDRCEIAGLGMVADGAQHAFLLIPVGQHEPHP